MATASPPPIIAFDYQYAPNAQRARNLLNLTGIPYSICEQPFGMPRPILANLGITYRRIPVNAIGKDVYVDNRVFLDAVLTLFAHEKGVQELVRTKADNAYEAFGYRMFWNILEILPDSVYVDEMVQDRKHLYGPMLSRPDYREVRPSALAAFKQYLDIIENEFLADGGPWINGAKPGVADLQTCWIPKFALETIEYAEDESLGLGKDRYPRVHEWISGVPAHVTESEAKKISGEEATKQILGSAYAAKELGVEKDDLTGFKAGDKVQVGTMDDTTPNNAPQYGTLVGLNRSEIVVELKNSLRVHFPRIGYSVKKA